MSNQILEINATTGEQSLRDMTAKEVAEMKAIQAIALAEQQEKKAKETARQSALEKLAALGLTEAEIQALAG